MALSKRNWLILSMSGVLACAFGVAATAKPLDGVTLNVASQNDQFATVMAALAPKFAEATGATVKVDILDYGSLLTKTTADFVLGFATGWPEHQPDIMVLSLTTQKGIQDFAFNKEQALLIAKTIKETAGKLEQPKTG